LNSVKEDLFNARNKQLKDEFEKLLIKKGELSLTLKKEHDKFLELSSNTKLVSEHVDLNILIVYSTLFSKLNPNQEKETLAMELEKKRNKFLELLKKPDIRK
jgi:hypothetical protein